MVEAEVERGEGEVEEVEVEVEEEREAMVPKKSVREDRVDVLMSSMPKGDSFALRGDSGSLPFSGGRSGWGPISGWRDRGAVSQG